MSYYSIYRQCVKLRKVLRSNVHDVRKICLEMTLCVQAYFIEFYVFVLNEIHVIGAKLIQDHVWVGNVQEKILKDQQRILEEGPKLGVKKCPRQPPNDGGINDSCSYRRPDHGPAGKVSVPDHGPAGQSVGQGMVRRSPSVCEVVVCAASLLSEG